MSIFLHYDVKGIQSFLFKIPKLKYIVGGSALIDRFDKETVKGFDGPDTKLIFSGGGKGVFLCGNDADAHYLKEKLIKEAYDVGLDIQFGQNEDFRQAARNADELYPFLPEIHEGEPCPASGFYPVKEGEECHKVVKKRRYNKGEPIFRYFEKFFFDADNPQKLVVPGRLSEEIVFFHNVNSDDPDEKESGEAGAEALGKRNRWAVIYMDGNDIGSQFREKLEKDLSQEEMQTWIKKMSEALTDITKSAASKAIQKVISKWLKTEAGEKAVKEKKELTLPIRPLIMGGDDLIVLCHCSYAFTFVKELIDQFNDKSKDQKYSGLWTATNGELSISAGILFAPVTTPLHAAIPYAEALLDSAKNYGRKKAKKGEATPACIDWEQITETVIDTPESKRNRELIFCDEEIDSTVKLTQRPYTREELSGLEDMAKKYEKELPRTSLHKILPALKKSYAERLAFYASIKKNHPQLFKALNEFEIKQSDWEVRELDGKKEQSIKIIDAIMLLEEKSRMEKETV
jgi:hypothetical protein